MAGEVGHGLIEALAERDVQDRKGAGHVRSGSGEAQVGAEVSDNGPGIPASNLAMVFDPFYTTKQPGKGTGLGLNIVYRIVTKYRGHIGVESIPGEGTVFTLSFPTSD